MPTPREVFEENVRPAELLLCVHRLLDNERVLTDGELLHTLRRTVRAGTDEMLMLISNSVFLGLIREGARVNQADLKRSKLDNLLRQAVVVSCSALETFLYALLLTNLSTVIRTRKSEFMPQDKEVRDFLRGMPFQTEEALRVLTKPEEAPELLGGKILSVVKEKYLKSRHGIHVVGTLLGLERPWSKVAGRLARSEQDLQNVLQEATERRNDIVHRADRPKSDPNGDIQAIDSEWVKQVVDTVTVVCRSLDKLVACRIKELQEGLPPEEDEV